MQSQDVDAYKQKLELAKEKILIEREQANQREADLKFKLEEKDKIEEQVMV